MLRHGHRYYHVHMDEYGCVLFNTIFHAAQLMDRGRSWGRSRTNRIRRRAVGATPREEATISVEQIISLMRKARGQEPVHHYRPEASRREYLASLEGAHIRR